MKARGFVLLIGLTFGILQVAQAATYYVATNGDDGASGDDWANAKWSIQGAINVAAAGDTVLVSNGVYSTGTYVTPGGLCSNRVAITNAIAVRSVNGPAVTVIEGMKWIGVEATRGVYVGSNASLTGFTVTNGCTRYTGNADRDMSGGAVWCETSGIVSNCILTGSMATNNGGAVNHGTLANCLIVGNTASLGGGAAFCTMYNCTIVGNKGWTGAGCYSSTLYNCIIYTNYAYLPVNGLNNTSNSILSYCCTMPAAGGNGNITNDPRFANSASGDYHLAVSSPCINAGSNGYARGSVDLDGKTRIQGGRVDMGAYEGTSNTVTLNVVASPSSAGTTTGFGTYYIGSNAVISAMATNYGWLFTAWNDGDTNATRTVIVPGSNVTFTANFIWDSNLVFVTVQSSPASAGAVAGGGIYPIGSNAVISASAYSGCYFSSWNDGDTNLVRSIIVPSTDITYTAIFSNLPLQLVGIPADTNIICGQAIPAANVIAIGGCDPAAPSTNGLSLHYSFDSTIGSNVLDSSGSGNNGALYGGAQIVTNAFRGAALSLDGTNSLVLVPGSLQAAEVTLSMWLWERSSKSGGADAANGHVIYCANLGTQLNELSSNAGNLNYFMATNGLWHATGALLPLTSWTHVAVVRTTDGVVRLYKNGVLAYTNMETIAPVTLLPLHLGAWGMSTNITGLKGFFDGQLDELCIYRRAFSSNEVQLLYSGAGNGAPVSLVETTNGTCPKVVTRVWTASDSCGSSISATQLVTLVDTHPPTLVGVPSNVTQYCWQPLPSSPTVTAVDNCSSATVQFVEVNTGTCPGTVTRTWTAFDACGNVTSKTQVITLLQQYVMVNVVTNPVNGGTVIGNGVYPVGTNVLLTATPAPFWFFRTWNDSNTNALRTIIVPTSNVTYTATFLRQTSTVTVVANPVGKGAVSGGGTYQAGSNIVITATPVPHWAFAGWNDGDTNTPRTITVPATNIIFTANFIRPSPGYWYVSTNGNDSAVGTSWATAMRTIQAAIDVAYSNDIIIVSNGTYGTGWRYAPGQPMPPLPTWPTRLVISNTVTVMSLNGPAVTTIDGAGSFRCVYLDAGATIAGFTLSDGLTVSGAFMADGYGAGVYGTSPSCTASVCLINANEASHAGGGAYGCTLAKCFLTDNISDGKGGGASGCALNNCVLAGNYSAGGAGGGADNCAVNNCTLTGNAALTDGGGAQGCAMFNSIAYFNTSDISSANYNCSRCTNSYCCTVPLSPGPGNLTNDPQLVNASAGDYTLAASSPCIDAGTNSCVQGDTDLAGNMRIVNGVVDMGAFELSTILAVRADPTNGGTVSGGGAYQPGLDVVITATPGTHWSFTGWNDGDTNAVRSITVPASNVTYTATFAQQTAVIGGQANPSYAGNVGGTGVYQIGSGIIISAVPDIGWLFTSWDDGDTNATRTITVPETNIIYTANFVQQMATLIVQADPGIGGSVSGGGTYQAGSNVVITATPQTGWRFLGWNDGNALPVRSVVVPATGQTYLATFHTSPTVDSDGDGRSNFGVYWPAGGAWNILGSSGQPAQLQFGWSADVAVMADYDGDGKADYALFENIAGRWYIIQSSSGIPVVTNWGGGQAVPVPADYDGDGKADLAVYDPPSGAWSILQSSNHQARAQQWGWIQAIPVPADYDGDGKADIAVYVPATGTWSILQSGNGKLLQVNWGWSQAMPVPADYDGDGKTDIATYVPANGTWYILRSSDGGLTKQQWGWSQAAPVPGDYDGDGKADIATYTPALGMWYVLKSSGGMMQQQWGWSQAVPVTPQFQINRRYFPTP